MTPTDKLVARQAVSKLRSRGTCQVDQIGEFFSIYRAAGNTHPAIQLRYPGQHPLQTGNQLAALINSEQQNRVLLASDGRNVRMARTAGRQLLRDGCLPCPTRTGVFLAI